MRLALPASLLTWGRFGHRRSKRGRQGVAILSAIVCILGAAVWQCDLAWVLQPAAAKSGHLVIRGGLPAATAHSAAGLDSSDQASPAVLRVASAALACALVGAWSSRRARASSGCRVASAAVVDDEAVARTVIQPLYRSIPQSNTTRKGPLQILLLSETNICRSPVAEAMLRAELQRVGLGGTVECASKAVRSYAVGEEVPQSVRDACQLRGLSDVDGHKAALWNPEWDVVDFDLILAVDRYVAADAMKEVSVWDTIQKEVEYCFKIRGLYEFDIVGQDIDDPLYGNVGGDEERAALEDTFDALQKAVSALVARLVETLGAEESLSREEAVGALETMLDAMGEFDWNAPPMLRKRSAPPQADLSDGLMSIGD